MAALEHPSPSRMDHDQVMESMLRHAAGQIGPARLVPILTDLLVGTGGPDAAHLLAVARRDLTTRIQDIAFAEICEAQFADSPASVVDGAHHHRQQIPRRGGLERALDAARRLDDSVLGDLLGAICLFGGGYLMMIGAGVLS